MTQVPLPDELKVHVTGPFDEVALTDADGRVVAYVVSPERRQQMPAAPDPFSDEELAAAREEYRTRGGTTLSEVYAELRARGIPGVPPTRDTASFGSAG